MAFLDSLKYRVKQAALIGGVGLAALTGRGQSNTLEENTIDAFTPDRIEALGRMMGYDLQNTLNQEGGLPLTKETAVWPDPNDPNTMYEMDETGNPISKIEFKPDANGNMQAIRQNMRNDGGYDGPVVGSEPRGPNITDYTDSDEYNDTNQETDSAQTNQDTPTVEPPAPARRKSKMSFFSNVGGPHSTDYYYDDNGKLTPHNPDEPGQSQTDQATPSDGTDNAGSDAPAAKPDGYDAAYDAPTTDMTGATNAPAAPQQPYYSDQEIKNAMNWIRFSKGRNVNASPLPEDIAAMGGIGMRQGETYLLRDKNDPTKFHEYDIETRKLKGTRTIQEKDGTFTINRIDSKGNITRTDTINPDGSLHIKREGFHPGEIKVEEFDNSGQKSSSITYNSDNPDYISYTTYKRNANGETKKSEMRTGPDGIYKHQETMRSRAPDGSFYQEVREDGQLSEVKFGDLPGDVEEITYQRDEKNPELWIKKITIPDPDAEILDSKTVTETGKDGKPVYYKLDETKLGMGLAFTPAVEQNSVQDTKATGKPIARKSGKMQDILKSHSMPVKPNFVPGMDGSSRTNRVDRVNVAAPAGSQTTFVPTPALLKALGDKKQK